MSLYISGNKLFEYLVAYILRNNGYIAGVPRRKLGGRGTQHAIGVVGIDLNNSPFCLNTVLLVAARGPAPANHNTDMQLVRNLKATLLDLEQTLPSRRELIRDLLDNNRGDLFHRIYGGKKAKEALTVHYVGGIFVAGEFSYPAWEYANAHGIYVVHLPELMAGQTIFYWYRQIRNLLAQVLSRDGKLTLPGLAKKTKKIPDFRDILLLLQQPQREELLPEHSHDLFTIFNELLRTAELSTLARGLQRTAIATINGYPVVMEYNVGYKALLDAALTVYERKIKTIKSVAPATTYKPLDVIHLRINATTMMAANQVHRLCFRAEQDNVPPAIQDLAGAVYVPAMVLDKRSAKRFRLKMPLKAGLSLVCEFTQEPDLTADAVR
ncbi:hypothetical protein [Desulforamulus hydrothermalis]|uniref:Uncharacterized protein n=1 Tax=Desulforamulus hydrothermalis Lam5 = DSM 18033 TaxID=1121428 RepID=K8E0H1_9FIRM|nr:hypothetical protein [Desulforamulus hydrothermalis]CCO09079.1 conserved hypothetical protein [Desulforamulus hydrothermalis Lam5 = DSM 18033]SHG78531.1 hypothetical protein SAMN02745177_00396 [Desulforamulus hydrothermalis Lam5 = DSM 18033]